MNKLNILFTIPLNMCRYDTPTALESPNWEDIFSFRQIFALITAERSSAKHWLCLAQCLLTEQPPVKENKGKEEYLYSAFLAKEVHSGMDHTVLPANNSMPAFPSWAFTRWHHHSNWGSRHPIAAYYSLIDPKRMKGWVGLVGWHIADGLPTWVVTHQLQVERRTAKARRPTTDVLLLDHATQ